MSLDNTACPQPQIIFEIFSEQDFNILSCNVRLALQSDMKKLCIKAVWRPHLGVMLLLDPNKEYVGQFVWGL